MYSATYVCTVLLAPFNNVTVVSTEETPVGTDDEWFLKSGKTKNDF